MHIHILGICGTFMGGVAALAKAAGHRVTGSDENVYPPMSTQLAQLGIEVSVGYDPVVLEPAPECVVVGNAMTRGNACVEAMLDRGLTYTSGPQWLSDEVLRGRWVLAVSGTHGKTTTASLLAWILEYAGLAPGFLIGGVAQNFGVTARLGESPFFVVEADEYDTAFFDKRSKFVHYRPRTVTLNNLEFDHADIFENLAAIERQFHHLVRTVPASGLIVANGHSDNLQRVLDMGCWTPVETFAMAMDATWRADPVAHDRFTLRVNGQSHGEVAADLSGRHNHENMLAACAAARHAGVPVATSIAALREFRGVRRRLELRGHVNNIAVYDDFAHHPTAVAATLAAVREAHPGSRVIAVLEPRSNTMKMGCHRDTLADSLREADSVWLSQPAGMQWQLAEVAAALGDKVRVRLESGNLAQEIAADLEPGDRVVIMSNGSFGGLHDRLLEVLQKTDGE